MSDWRDVMNARSEADRELNSLDDYGGMIENGQREGSLVLCSHHHADVTEYRHTRTLQRLAESLSDAEYAYVIGKLGEGALERLFGLRFEP